MPLGFVFDDNQVKLRVFLLVLFAFPPASRAFAQTVPGAPDPSKARVRIGPLWMNPTLALTNAGLDTNVFNEADPDVPKRDFTLTITPQVELWLPMGRTWLAGNVKGELVWYQKYSSERSSNNNYTVGWLIPLNRLSFSVGGNRLTTRERPGFEIDARAQRNEIDVNGAVEVRALSNTFFGVRAERGKVDFDQNAVFLGTNLHDELNRTVTSSALTIRHQFTPLTNVTIDAALEQGRFDFSPERDSDSTLIGLGVTFDPLAVINGSAQIGFRDFKPLSPGVPGFTGTTVSVNLSYVALGSTKLSVQAARDVQYSYQVDQPYYLQTGVSGSFAQQLFGPLEVVGRIGAQRLDYRDRAEAEVAVSDRTDHVRSYGGGFGYHMGRELRLGFDIDRQKRTSGVSYRQYDGLRYGTSVTYGL